MKSAHVGSALGQLSGDNPETMTTVPVLDHRPLLLWPAAADRRPDGGYGVAVTPYIRDAFAAEVAAKWGLKPRQVLDGRCMRGNVARARQELMWRLRSIRTPSGRPKHSFPLIAKSLGLKDHTAVMHGCKTHARSIVG